MKTKLLSSIIATSLILFTQTAFAQTELDLISNGSFETGDLTGWEASTVNGVDEGLGTCSINWIVLEDSTEVCGNVPNISPLDGEFAAYTSFDSAIANTEWILDQTVSIPADASSATVIFTFEAGFDFSLGELPTRSRAFRVQLFETDGTFIGEIFSLEFPATPSLFFAQHIDETNDVFSMIDGFQGTDIIIRFSAFVPEVLTGPSKSLVDNVSFLVDTNLSVEDNELNNDISIFPNPANDFFELNYSGNQQLTDVKVYDLNNRLVKSI